MLQSITMPTKNFFHSSLTPARSLYQFLYITHKRPISLYMTCISLNCTVLFSDPLTGILLNCQHSWLSSSMMLNCRTLQTMHDMSNGHIRHLGHLRHQTYSGMPSGLYILLGHLGQLGHPSHLGHLGYLSNIGNLNTLNPYSLTTTPIDSYFGAFITEMDPNDPGLIKGYFTDNLLNPFL
jgi:hypothetical protein